MSELVERQIEVCYVLGFQEDFELSVAVKSFYLMSKAGVNNAVTVMTTISPTRH